MGVMAKRARFGDGRMLPQERPAFIRVAGVTGIVHIVFDQQEVTVAVVNIMAITAGHAAEAQRVPGRLVGIRTGPGMAGEAGFLLLDGIEHRIAVGMDGMAGNTAHIDTFVAAAEPTGPGMGLVAAQACPVLIRDRGTIAFAERPCRLYFCLVLCFPVILGGTVASLALQV